MTLKSNYQIIEKFEKKAFLTKNHAKIDIFSTQRQNNKDMLHGY